MTQAPQLSCHSPVGDLTISEDDGAIVSLDFGRGMTQTPTALLDDAAAPGHDLADVTQCAVPGVEVTLVIFQMLGQRPARRRHLELVREHPLTPAFLAVDDVGELALGDLLLSHA